MTARSETPWLSAVVRLSGLLLALSPFLPPIFDHYGMTSLAALLDTPWVGMCHRMPERSLFMYGEPMPLCTRCLGLVVGLGLGMLVAWPPLTLRALRISFGLGCAFLFLELTTQDLGWHPVFHPTRILSGLLVAFPVGAAAGAVSKRIRVRLRESNATA
jgi:uncharacterized membrane protein